MTMKHTPGPWEIHEEVVYSTDGFLIASAEANYEDHIEIQAANAKLIAAAPELLNALVAFIWLYDSDDGCKSLPQYIAAKEAIKKATNSN